LGIDVEFFLEVDVDILTNISGLIINETEIDIGSCSIQHIKRQNYPDVVIGTSPYYEYYEVFPVWISNEEPDPVIIIELSYFLDGEKVNAIQSPIVVGGGQELDIMIPTSFTDNNYAVRPIIVYEYNDMQYQKVPVSTTEYTTSLSKEEILEYIKKNGL
jgi:hypothetical protein